MSIFKNLFGFGRLKEKQIAKKKEQDRRDYRVSSIHQRYKNETGKEATEFRMKSYRNTEEFDEWRIKNNLY